MAELLLMGMTHYPLLATPGRVRRQLRRAGRVQPGRVVGMGRRSVRELP